MTDNNNKFTVPQAPKTYEVRYLEQQEQQKPKLSPAARAKVVNNGSYVSSKITDLVPSYGPCSTCHNKDIAFRLRIVLKNAYGGSKSMVVYNTDDAREEATNIIARREWWAGDWSTSGSFRQKNRDDLASKINSVIRRHNSGEEINEVVTNERYIW